MLKDLRYVLWEEVFPFHVFSLTNIIQKKNERYISQLLTSDVSYVYVIIHVERNQWFSSS